MEANNLGLFRYRRRALEVLALDPCFLPYDCPVRIQIRPPHDFIPAGFS